ncbi:Protein SSXA1 [Frankliniella fusca]|uniref:Protein SSXA1 n=1 Tax=Frankliniella fusca TaxID=407009 RepID=A0AAE1LS70_9NEOP|nr:Protein SSXA1 [Frankliniella fusca]
MATGSWLDMGVQEFAQTLMSKRPVLEEAINILKDQKITGKLFMKLEISHLNCMGIKFGDAMELVELVKQCDTLQSDSSDRSDAETQNRNAKDSSGSLSDRSESGNKENFRKNVDSFEMSLGEDSDVETPSQDETYSDIQPYFSDEDFKDLSDYDKSAYLSQYRNYQTLCKTMAPAKPKMPAFMNFNKGNKGKTNSSVKKGNLKAQKSKNTSILVEKQNEHEQAPSSSKPSTTVKSADKSKQSSDVVESSSDHEQASSSSKTSASTRSGALGKSKRVSVSTCDLVKKKSKKAVDFRACYGPNDMPEDEYITNLPDYDVDEILKDAGDKLKETRIQLKSNGIVFDKERKAMIRALTKHLFFKSVPSHRDITAVHKEGLAASVVKRYPCFKDCSDSSKYSWHHLFHRRLNQGFIANVTQNIYRQMDATERRRHGKGQANKSSMVENKSNPDDPPPYNSADYKYLSLLLPNKTNKKEIMTAMEDSYKVRRGWIYDKHPSVSEILIDFPHLISYNGEVLEEEFCRMHPDSNSLFIKDFPVVIQKLKVLKGGLVSVEEMEIEEIQACFTISKLLPRPNFKRRNNPGVSLIPSLDTLVVPLIRGTDPRKYVQDKRNATNQPVQPYLLASYENNKILRMFVALDGQVLQIQSNSVLKGLDVLFKTYFVFNVNYPSAWLTMFEFIEKCIYKINVQAITNSMAELKKKIDYVNL